jgi:hypothetical protein
MKNSATISKWSISILFLVALVAPVFSSFYKYYFTQNYDYLVEAECNPEIEICYIRDCSNPDDCPPNGYEEYKQYYLKAYDFKKCSDNSCKTECENDAIDCEEIVCGEFEEDICSNS